jgi:hypothetical protein
MRNLNLKIAIILYGVIHAVYGIVMLAVPDRLTEFYGFAAAFSAEYFLALLGGAFIAAGIWFIMAGLSLANNASTVKFAVLWSAIMLVVPLFSLWLDYINFGHIWFMVVINAIFCGAFLIFYPRTTD